MEVENISLENLRIQHAHLDAVIKEEESHIWKNCIKIEELKNKSSEKRRNAAPDYANSRSLTKRILLETASRKEQPFFNGYLNTPMLH